eukprot:GABV01014312.1.p1 GENE.GABV01014312.1~~GABV01014312.1.p1  ORF type:complete len:104 (+),score=4.25 GABV01014312.1:75-386(+)
MVQCRKLAWKARPKQTRQLEPRLAARHRHSLIADAPARTQTRPLSLEEAGRLSAAAAADSLISPNFEADFQSHSASSQTEFLQDVPPGCVDNCQSSSSAAMEH